VKDLEKLQEKLLESKLEIFTSKKKKERIESIVKYIRRNEREVIEKFTKLLQATPRLADVKVNVEELLSPHCKNILSYLLEKALKEREIEPSAFCEGISTTGDKITEHVGVKKNYLYTIVPLLSPLIIGIKIGRTNVYLMNHDLETLKNHLERERKYRQLPPYF
jgi:hypothetical protein